jgi:hypothetical protein
VYDDTVVDFVVFAHLICDSAVLTCSGSFMSLQNFDSRWKRWMLSFMVSSFLPSFLSSSVYLIRSGVRFTGRCCEFMNRCLTPASLLLDLAEHA